MNSLTIKSKYLIINLDSSKYFDFIIFLRYSNIFQFNLLLDIWAVDYLFDEFRFEINYLLLSPLNNLRIIIKVRIKEFQTLNSVTSIFNSADWLEREIWDMFGIFFLGHNDLRRILSDYGFEGYPLRKDFPLSGFLEIKYDDEEKRIVFDKVEFLQSYRFFDFKNPWFK